MRTKIFHLKKTGLVLLSLCFLICSGTAQSPEIEYKVYGEGPGVIIIPGTRALDVPLFENLAEGLASFGFQVILYNPAGTEEGYQLETSEDISIDERVEEIEIIRKELNISSWSVIGTTLGNLIACYYATDYPLQVNRMVFVSPSLTKKDHFLYQAKSHKEEAMISYKIAEKKFPEYSQKDIFIRNVDQFAGQLVYNPMYADTVKEALLLIFPYEHIPGLLDEVVKNPPDFGYIERNFADRILIISGENDKEPKWVRIESKQFMEQFSQTEIFSVEHCGRFVWLEQKSTFYDKVIDFLNKY